MSAFQDQLGSLARDPAGRRWLYIAYDQLTDSVGPLAAAEPCELGIVLVESLWKPAQRSYHKHKLATVLANMRHFALEQAARGVAVRYLQTRERYGLALAEVAGALGQPLTAMRPAERELRRDLAPLVEDDRIALVNHDGWLTTTADFTASQKRDAPPYRMDAFYRHVRRATGLLMDDRGKPLGGKFSHDAANRQPWLGKPPAPEPPEFTADPVTEEVIKLVETRFASHPGTVNQALLAASRDDAESLWEWAKAACLSHFGPYEDAMSASSAGLFHTRISPLLNLCRLLPAQVVDDVAALDVPLASKEGFIRQVLGWREFVRHVHDATDGLREIPGRGAGTPNFLGAGNPLPPVFWGEVESGLRCLDQVVGDVWREAYSHHITRLMVLSNLATLLDVDPRALTDWFWVAYADAYDWVVEPNVLGMGTFAAGELMTTKPYVSGAAYIDRMSDYCGSCAFRPKYDCPITPLYWAFLDRHRDALAANPRLRLPLAGLASRAKDRREADRRTFERVVTILGRGERVTPA